MKRIVLLFLVILCGITVSSCFFYESNSDLFDIKFHNDPCIKPYKRYHYLTCHSIYVTVDHFVVIVPPNFDTDLASIPKWLWVLVAPSHSAFISPSILHDYLYMCHNGYTRKEIDYIFYQSLINNGVHAFTAYEMYLAVRMFGSEHYRKKEKCYSIKQKRVKKTKNKQINK